MDPLTLFLIGSIASTLIGGYTSARGAIRNQDAQREANQLNLELKEKEMQYNADQAQINRNWQYMMSSTAHQREMADLQAAGLNPILAAGGSGAPVVGSSAAQSSSAQVKAETLDYSGLSSMFNSLSNTMLTYALINGKFDAFSTNEYKNSKQTNPFNDTRFHDSTGELTDEAKSMLRKFYNGVK